jgi:hypothetical protein
MNIDKSTITAQLNQLLKLLQQHAIFIGIAGFCVVYGYIIMQISSLTATEPDQTKVTEQLKKVPRPKVDPEVVKTIEGLESENINVQAIITEARENPFSE